MSYGLGKGAEAATAAAEEKRADQAFSLEQQRLDIEAMKDAKIVELENRPNILDKKVQLESLIRQSPQLMVNAHIASEDVTQALGRLNQVVKRAERVLAARERIRGINGSDLQEYRFNDLAYRNFRNNALQHYRTFYDLAAARNSARAAIPEPDVVLYGTVTSNGIQLARGDSLAVIARTQINGTMEEIGRHELATPCINTNGPLCAGDNYLLTIRVQSLIDGTTQDTSVALVGQTAEISVVRGSAGQVVDSIVIARGTITNQNYVLEEVLGDCNESWTLGLDDLSCMNNCLMGPNTPAAQNCTAVDVDDDGDVDLSDFAAIQQNSGL